MQAHRMINKATLSPFIRFNSLRLHTSSRPPGLHFKPLRIAVESMKTHAVGQCINEIKNEKTRIINRKTNNKADKTILNAIKVTNICP